MTVQQALDAQAQLQSTEQKPPPARFRWYVGELLTGRVRAQVPLTGTQWSLTLDAAGAMSGKLPLADPAVARIGAAVASAPGRAFLAYSYDDGTGERLLDAGPVWPHDYDDDSQSLTIGASGLRSYFARRKVMPWPIPANPAEWSVTYEGLSLGTIAKRLVQLAAQHPAGALPIVLPDDETAADDADHTRTYHGYDLAWVSGELDKLTQVIDGPELDLVPRFRADDARFIEWVMRTGTEADPLLHQAGDDWTWDGSAIRSPVYGVGVQVDGNGLGSRAWVKGSGEAEGTLIAWGDDPTLTDLGYPLLEVDASSGHENVEQPATLAGYVAGTLQDASRPVATWKAKVRADATPTLGNYRPGDWATFVVRRGHPYLPPGPYRTRIVQVSGADNDEVNLQLAPTPGSL